MDAETPNKFFQRFGPAISFFLNVIFIGIISAILFSPPRWGIIIFVVSGLVSVLPITWFSAGMFRNHLINLRSKAKGELPPMPTPQQIFRRNLLVVSSLTGIAFIYFFLAFACYQFLSQNLPPNSDRVGIVFSLGLWGILPATWVQLLLIDWIDTSVYYVEGIKQTHQKSHAKIPKSQGWFLYFLFLLQHPIIQLIYWGFELHYQEKFESKIEPTLEHILMIYVWLLATISTLWLFWITTETSIRFRMRRLNPKSPEYEEQLLTLERALYSPAEQTKGKLIRGSIAVVTLLLMLGVLLATWLKDPSDKTWLMAGEVLAILGLCAYLAYFVWSWKIIKPEEDDLLYQAVRRGQYSLALEYSERLNRKLTPVESTYAIAHAQMLMGNLEQAQTLCGETLTELLEVSPNQQDKHHIARLLWLESYSAYFQEDFPKAIRLAEQTLLYNPHNSGNHAVLAEILLHLDQELARAEAHVDKVLELNSKLQPHQQMKYTHLMLKAWVLAKKGERDEAQRLIDEGFASINPEDKLFVAEAHLSVGRIMVTLEDFPQATIHYQTAAELDSTGINGKLAQRELERIQAMEGK